MGLLTGKRTSSYVIDYQTTALDWTGVEYDLSQINP